MHRFRQADLNKVRTISLKNRKSKVEISAAAKVLTPAHADKFFDSLPKYLKAADLIEFISRVATSRKRGFPFHLLMGAHVIKVGLSPIIIDLMKNKIVTGLSFNSAGLIHDLELAFTGQTSEDVRTNLADGSFGMAADTGAYFGGVVDLADKEAIGLGEAAGIYINKHNAKYRDMSLFAAADKLNAPATVHLVIGTDIVHQQGNFRAGPAAEASYRDFKILANFMSKIDRGGAAANIGSSVILPEVFLKALTVARNLKKTKCNITTANFDMINHYRPMKNVVQRPTANGGRGYNFIGHHEIMIPLLAWGIKSYMSGTKLQSGV
jgi:hypothetical protein